jgi:hypothetical protein
VLDGFRGVRRGRAPLRARGGAGRRGDGRSTSPDIEWVRHALDGTLRRVLDPAADVAVPAAATIERAFGVFGDHCDSVRAVRKVREHPGQDVGRRRRADAPALPPAGGRDPTHSRQTAALPEVWVQDSSLEIAWTRIVADGEIAGQRVAPFFPEGLEGLSIDYPDDLEQAERLVAADPRSCRSSELMEAATFAANAPIELRYVGPRRCGAAGRPRSRCAASSASPTRAASTR